jgi:hypothetical protein
MKRVVTFFLFLCFLLLGGNYYVYASAHNSKICYSPAPEKMHPAESANANHNYIITKYTGSVEENVSLVTVEDQDDEDNSKKHILPKYFITFSHAFLLIHWSCLIHSLPFCRQQFYTSSCKYILQRVLRI